MLLSIAVYPCPFCCHYKDSSFREQINGVRLVSHHSNEPFYCLLTSLRLSTSQRQLTICIQSPKIHLKIWHVNIYLRWYSITRQRYKCKQICGTDQNAFLQKVRCPCFHWSTLCSFHHSQVLLDIMLKFVLLFSSTFHLFYDDNIIWNF